MRHLLASTGLVAVAAILAGPASAQTVIDTRRTSGVATSTVNNGAANSIRITTAGSVEPTGGTAVAIDSDHGVTNEGAILISNADGATGIGAVAGATGSITNAAGGRIVIDETYAPTDADNDGDLDGPLAAGRGWHGILTAGRFTGDIVNSGTITIEGNDSAGIRLGGPLVGRFTTDGTIGVIGDRSVGVALGDVSGAVRIAGTITAQGQGARAVAIGGNLAGALVVQGTISSTGYRATTAPADTSKLDADDLLQGGPALSIAGDVAGGIVLAIPPADKSATDNDEDKDGIEDSKEGSAAVTSYGAAPAMQIGAADRAVTIGAVAGTGTGHGLVIEGNVSGQGIYAGVSATGLQIGVGGAVQIAGGMTVTGGINAVSTDASATAVRIGAGARVPEVRNAGLIAAAGGGGAGVQTGAIDNGGSVDRIANSGTIRATTKGDGTAVAIVDRTGQLARIDNSGTIAAVGGKAGTMIAIDLSANNAGATVAQTVVASGVAAPSISGDVLFGSGNDTLDLADGGMTGTTRFGAGANRLALSGDTTYAGAAQFGAGNDTLAMTGTSVFTGTADFGGGADSLTIGGTARFAGTLANAQGLAVAMTGGTLDIGTSQAAVRSLSLGAGSTLAVSIDGATSTRLDVSGAASFAEGSRVSVRVSNITGAEGRHSFLRAGSVSGAANLAATGAALPYMFKSSIAVVSPTELAIDIARKTSGELGLNRSQAAAYGAIYDVLARDAKVAGAFLDTTDGDRFRRQVRQMLPDHAGGTFETVTMGSRATAAILADPNAPFADQGKWGYWLQQVGWGTGKKLGDTASYDITGWGASGGAEAKTDAGHFGLSLAYLFGRDADGGTDNKVDAAQYEAAAYWRLTAGGFTAAARGSYAMIDFKGKRSFSGAIGSESVERRASAKWNGRLVSASGRAAYEMGFGTFSLRPAVAADYYRLREGGYGETGGGDAYNLTVDRRTSDELAVTGTVTAGLLFGGFDQDSGWFKLEAEGGRRQLVGGSLGATTARFGGGQSFTLTPEDRTNGWVGKLRATGGGNGFRIGGEASAEQQQGRAAIALRASLAIGL
ncbi:autotransporter outer membrane beta-barrel domain-containing protein [Sphingomonas naphthae]|uniref:Autotransporter outer membrane beta-barrel domain-containing protein n=1 Tax=Sphingomonas naphthae TaxID=1813468 RepID=A0ABY7TFV8_9SPHN|nr:autotransporter outer membrane beta-barrel domain-containing protein [Sphingomonas naphthae]WCT71856.1 autotransporter outer membrane beta-barrel domain-containing protein [Sphingomonas naphthae]